ncbi:hypothetical protein JT359_05455 [Candidatus Poribacteria bacterium]|nr:hypothetical protein [Candidatus Poribacteria bacterium]
MKQYPLFVSYLREVFRFRFGSLGIDTVEYSLQDMEIIEQEDSSEPQDEY